MQIEEEVMDETKHGHLEKINQETVIRVYATVPAKTGEVKAAIEKFLK
jgi:hypothetical protein